MAPKYLLNVNDDKINIINLASLNCVIVLKSQALFIGESLIASNESTKVPGLPVDKYINMYEYITSVCRALNI